MPAREKIVARLKAPERARLRRRLLDWFATAARDLPWRRTRDPYAVWVSEVMLQQTQVATVEGYFPRFIAAFPTIAALAGASEHDVLRQWEGLGYYRRARQLHAAARLLVAEHGGHFPCDPETVRQLPGIGRYTLGAILSIAFDQPLPVLEANTYRLLARLIAFRGDPRDAHGQRILWAFAEELVQGSAPGALNQALMELGATICTPRQPRCDACPVARRCAARAEKLQDSIPPPLRKPEITPVQEAALVVRRSGRVLIVQSDGPGRWAGLWDFPRLELPARRADESALLIDAAQARWGLDIALGERFATVKYGVTRFRITLDAYDAECVGGAKRSFARQRWVRPSELADFPLNASARRLARQWLTLHAPKARRRRRPHRAAP